MSPSPKSTSNGPFLTQAILCERVLRESDGVLSAMRIVDTITAEVVPLTEEAAKGATKPPGVRRKLFALITIKSGGISGKKTARLACDSLGIEMSTPLVFEGAQHGNNLVLEMDLEVPEGVHWFSVYLSGKLMTKFPLRAIIRLGEVGSTGSVSLTTAQE